MLYVRFVNGLQDLRLESITQDSTVKDIIDQITEKYPQLSQQSLRLVHHGRILVPEQKVSDSISWMESIEADLFLHCVVSDLPASGAGNSVEANRGFDRLLEIGFSREDVENFRSQFRGFRGQTENEEEIRNAEDAWIDNRQTADEGNAMDIFVGMIVGFLAGILVIAFWKEQGMFTRRQEVGVYLGLLMNLVFGMTRYSYY